MYVSGAHILLSSRDARLQSDSLYQSTKSNWTLVFCKAGKGSGMVLNITKTLRDCVWNLDSEMVHDCFASSGSSLRGGCRVGISCDVCISFSFKEAVS